MTAIDGQMDIFDQLEHRVITSHCFFQRWCQHVVTGFEPREVHDRMEAHYEAEHYGKHMTIVNQEAGR